MIKINQARSLLTNGGAKYSTVVFDGNTYRQLIKSKFIHND